jgi:hypothetical protein
VTQVGAKETALCGALSSRVWLPHEAERWRIYLSSDDDLVVYCRECAEREFGAD